jgi:hypothetical protein
VHKSIFVSILIPLVLCCSYSVPVENKSSIALLENHIELFEPDTNATILIRRFGPPEGYASIRSDSSTFGFYLQHLPLKKHGSLVNYYNSTTKSSKGVYCAVVDFSLGNRDLQQCADAVIRLRAEYLYSKQSFDDIHFNFVSDGKSRYYRDYANGDYSYPKFSKYLDYIFSYANTRSLHDELIPVEDVNKMMIGDVLIQKRNPYGHAVIIVNMAEEKNTGKKLFMLAQSYMPAQDIQILINPEKPEISPWYIVKVGSIHTPEWTFHSSDLRRFDN